MSRKAKQATFGDVDQETIAAERAAGLLPVESDTHDLSDVAVIEADPLPDDPRVAILWAHFVKHDTRYASHASSVPAVASDEHTKLFIDTIGGVIGISIEDPSLAAPGFVPMTNVASFVVKR